MTGAAYKLYGRAGAGSLAPQILLEEIGVPYEVLWVGRSSADIENFRRINPAGKIPLLVLADGTAVSESAAILIHLTHAHPAADFAPIAGTSAHARFLQWTVFLSANMYEAALRYFYPERYSAAGSSAAADIKAQGLADYTLHLEFIHAALSPYVLGAKLSAADCYLYMLAGWYPGGVAALSARCPKLAQHAELIGRRPATRRAERAQCEK
jgi:glutathione S-transferase